MRMDRTQRGWAVGSLAILAASTVAYLFYVWQSPAGPSGGSVMGLVFGITGFAFMIFAALLGARKRVPTWRLGRAQSWMRGHLWLGLLSLPMILFHGGFHFGGTLTRVLMWLTIIVVASGVYGAVLQNSLPSMMTKDVPLETIYDEIGNVRKALRMEADKRVESVCGDLGLVKEIDEGQRAGGFTALRPIAASAAPLRTSAAVSAGASAAVAAAPEIVLLTEEESTPLRLFYFSDVRAFLEAPAWQRQRFGDAERAKSAFDALRRMMPPAAHAALDDLEDICDETRQLMRQELLHRWLHGWLLVHIPLSLGLILLGAIHAVMDLRY
ncbi:MAG TPA: hypothetical protein VL128_14915 [Candidatus Eisenbacteria bacterium]|nr:hypothetical protein [Candidatus Eisenbacteria bacterium]